MLPQDCDATTKHLDVSYGSNVGMLLLLQHIKSVKAAAGPAATPFTCAHGMTVLVLFMSLLAALYLYATAVI